MMLSALDSSIIQSFLFGDNQGRLYTYKLLFTFEASSWMYSAKMTVWSNSPGSDTMHLPFTVYHSEQGPHSPTGSGLRAGSAGAPAK